MFKSTLLALTVSILLAPLASAAPGFSNLSARNVVCQASFGTAYATPATSCVCLTSSLQPVPNTQPEKCTCKAGWFINGQIPNCAQCDSSTTAPVQWQSPGATKCVCNDGMAWKGINSQGKGYCGPCPTGFVANSSGSCVCAANTVPDGSGVCVPCDLIATTSGCTAGATQCTCKNATLVWQGIQGTGSNRKGVCGCVEGTKLQDNGRGPECVIDGGIL